MRSSRAPGADWQVVAGAARSGPIVSSRLAGSVGAQVGERDLGEHSVLVEVHVALDEREERFVHPVDLARAARRSRSGRWRNARTRCPGSARPIGTTAARSGAAAGGADRRARALPAARPGPGGRGGGCPRRGRVRRWGSRRPSVGRTASSSVEAHRAHASPAGSLMVAIYHCGAAAPRRSGGSDPNRTSILRRRRPPWPSRLIIAAVLRSARCDEAGLLRRPVDLDDGRALERPLAGRVVDEDPAEPVEQAAVTVHHVAALGVERRSLRASRAGG